MSESMIERVARAVATADWRVDIDEYSEPKRWDEAKDAFDLTNNTGRFRYKNIASAAIEAMKEPTNDMIGNADLPYSPSEMKQYWEIMIDAALSEKP